MFWEKSRKSFPKKGNSFEGLFQQESFTQTAKPPRGLFEPGLAVLIECRLSSITPPH